MCSDGNPQAWHGAACSGVREQPERHHPHRAFPRQAPQTPASPAPPGPHLAIHSWRGDANCHTEKKRSFTSGLTTRGCTDGAVRVGGRCAMQRVSWQACSLAPWPMASFVQAGPPPCPSATVLPGTPSALPSCRAPPSAFDSRTYTRPPLPPLLIPRPPSSRRRSSGAGPPRAATCRPQFRTSPAGRTGYPCPHPPRCTGGCPARPTAARCSPVR